MADTLASTHRLAELLGTPVPARWTIAEQQQDHLVERGLTAIRMVLRRDDGEVTHGILTGPTGAWSDLPAILYCHAHGNRYEIGADELLDGRPALRAPPYADALAEAGIIALCIDMPCFGARRAEPESARAKRALWQGRTLFGEMLADLSGALTLLAAWPGVDAGRIGAFGISMGATQAFWLAALDPRIRAVAHLCCFADLGTLIEMGGHDLHGIYMTVPGLVPAISTGRIAGLVAPRPQFAGMGLTDPLTPREAVDIAVAEAREAYRRAGAGHAFEVLIDAESGHAEIAAMRMAVIAFFRRELR